MANGHDALRAFEIINSEYEMMLKYIKATEQTQEYELFKSAMRE